MPWSHPAARMREMILAIRAIWDSWNAGTKLDFRGDFYTHTLMTPFFNPGPNPYGDARIFLAGVGELMTEVAGEVADGFICHGFTTERYMREVTIPALERGPGQGRQDAGGLRDLRARCSWSPGATRPRWRRRPRACAGQIAFYGSTPAYRGVLELHGWGDLQAELNRCPRRAAGARWATSIDDEMLDDVRRRGARDEVAAGLLERCGDVVDPHELLHAVQDRPDPVSRTSSPHCGRPDRPAPALRRRRGSSWPSR